MKRIILLLSAVLLSVVLCSCGEPPTLNTDFSTDFSVTQDDVGYQGTLAVADGALSVDMTAPYTVAGLRFGYDENGLTIGCGGLETVANSDYIPPSSVPAILHNTLAYLPQATYTESSDSGDSFSLPTPYGEAQITAVDGVPKELYDPHSGLTFTFG